FADMFDFYAGIDVRYYQGKHNATISDLLGGEYFIDATRAKVIAELQVKSGNNWIPVAIWTADENFYTAEVYETHDVVKGHTYRVKGTFMVWEGSAYETEYSFSDEITA
ncbi:MAG: hypothetical protein IIV69_05260, partial [Peptococcaceae bacterium]|nr:hypothetical protein [Peptococcaceae bacterium]